MSSPKYGIATLVFFAAFLVCTPHALETSSGSRGVGDFVAQGLGMSTDASPSTSASTTTEANLSSYSSNSTTAVSFTSSRHELPSLSSSSATHVIGNLSWPSAENDDQCWAQWTSFWSGPASTPKTTSTRTMLWTETQEAFNGSTGLTTRTFTQTSRFDNGGFVGSDTTVTRTTTDSWSWTSRPAETSTSTLTQTYTYYTIVGKSLTAPSCSITASPYSGCQQRWSTWASDIISLATKPLATTYITSPSCQAASVGGEPCMGLKDLYVAGNQNLLGYWQKYSTSFSQGYVRTTASDGQEGWFWNSSLSLAPGCTMGCGRCAVTGSTIDFLFFPPGPTTDGPPATAVTLGTTLTSPTYYISFSRVWAQDACGHTVGGNYTSTIVPVPTTVSLSSIWGMPGVPHEMYAVSSVSLLTAPFNIDDLLQTPVPYSIYSSQPWCASELFWGQLDTTDTTTFECATTAPYKPIIVAPGEFLAKIDPAFASCSPEVKGFYDPPRALKKTDVAAAPTTPTPAGPAHTTPAQTARGSITHVLETTAHAPSHVEQNTAQHTNGPTAQEVSPSRTQNVGAMIASLVDVDDEDAVSAQHSSHEDPLTGNEATDVVAALQAAGSMVSAQQEDHAGPAVAQTAGSPDPTDPADPSPAGPGADDPPAENSSSGTGNTVTTNIPISHPQSDENALAEQSTLTPNAPYDPGPKPSEAIIPFGSNSITVIPSRPLVVLDHTLTVGGEAATVAGQQISVATGGVVVDGVTVSFSTSSAVGEANATASASQSTVVYTGDASGRQTRGSWMMLVVYAGFVAVLWWH